MSPLSSMNNGVDGGVADSEFSGQVLHGLPVVAPSSQFAHAIVAQLRCRAGFANCGVPPTLGVTISGVIPYRSQKQMIRPYARRIVAVMTNAQSRRNRAKVQCPRDAMRQKVPLPLPSGPHPSIAISILTPRPYPATLRLEHLLPEAPGQWHDCPVARLEWLKRSMRVTASVTTETAGMRWLSRELASAMFADKMDGHRRSNSFGVSPRPVLAVRGHLLSKLYRTLGDKLLAEAKRPTMRKSVIRQVVVEMERVRAEQVGPRP